MTLKDMYNELLMYVREGELCSCPYIVEKDNKKTLGLFTYIASVGSDVSVYGIGQIISYSESGVICEEGELFESEEEIITISDTRDVTPKERDELYDEYLEKISAYFAGEQMCKSAIKDIFCKLVSKDALKLYRRIIPYFVKKYID